MYLVGHIQILFWSSILDANTKWERYYEVLSQPFRSLTSHTSVLSSTNVASASSFPLLSESEAAFSKCSNSSDSKLRTSEDVINFSESTFETAALNFLNICNLQASFLSSTLPCNSGNNYNGKDLRLLIESYSQWLSSSKRYHINHLSKATEKHLSQTAGALGALPFSVTWLIETCAKLLEMKPALLCQEVVNVERDLLTACCKLKIY